MIKRDILPTLIEDLDSKQLMLLIGARQTGKTSLLKALKEDLEKKDCPTHYLTVEDKDILRAFNEHPEKLFQYVPKNEQKKVVLIDEIQYLDDPTNFLKYLWDQYSPTLKLIVTGSSAFYIDQKFKDSLAGRKRIYHIQSFSFREFLRAHDKDSLLGELATPFLPPKKRQWLVPQKRELISWFHSYYQYGGYPEVVLAESTEEKEERLKELHNSFLQKDFIESGIKKETKAFELVKLLASQAGQMVNINELSNSLNLSFDAVENYLYILRKSFIIRLCTPFHRNIRKELTKMPKVYFYDTGFRNSILQNFNTLHNRQDSGSLLENIFFKLLLHLKADSISYWRTQSKKEIDFVVDEKAAFELKLNTRQLNEKVFTEFNEGYPGISTQFVTFEDELGLDMLDFVT